MLTSLKHRDKIVPAALAPLLLTTTLGVGIALASSVHLKGGPAAEPTFFDNVLKLQARGDLAGLGGGDVVILLTATADATATCTNPGNGVHQPPGRNPAPVTVSGSEAIPRSEIKNGNTPFDVETNPPVTPIPSTSTDFGCPGPNWTEDITDLSFKTATIEVFQPAGTLVLTVSCTFTPSTSNGQVPAAAVVCTQS